MPSAVVLVSAKNEARFFDNSTFRKSLEKKLGAPVLEEVLAEPINLKALKLPSARQNPNFRSRNFLQGWEGRSGIDPKIDHWIVRHCRYIIKGKIVPFGYAGDANAAGMMTLGLTEVIMIPVAVREVSTGGDNINTFDVWYSADDQVLAYTWSWTEKK
jgi:hypothetical protein